LSLRIPLSPDQTLQTEFHEIERRLRRLEKSLGASGGSTTTIRVTGGGGGGAGVDLQPIEERLSALEATVASLDAAAEVPVFGAVGEDARRGLVPAPESAGPPDGVADDVLLEDATWGFPLRGLVGVTTDGTTDATDCVEVLGGLHVNSSLSADEVVARKATVGLLILPGILATSEDELSVAGLL